jgi:hypothetical protein
MTADCCFLSEKITLKDDYTAIIPAKLLHLHVHLTAFLFVKLGPSGFQSLNDFSYLRVIVVLTAPFSALPPGHLSVIVLVWV